MLFMLVHVRKIRCFLSFCLECYQTTLKLPYLLKLQRLFAKNLRVQRTNFVRFLLHNTVSLELRHWSRQLVGTWKTDIIIFFSKQLILEDLKLKDNYNGGVLIFKTVFKKTGLINAVVHTTEPIDFHAARNQP